jgi:DNA mismatch endonuclease, patch repair protein
MIDKISSDRRSANMAQIKSKNTKPEYMVRRLAHSLGYRFRLHRKDLPGKPDLAFPSRKAVIFVHGCFWHVHPDPNCKDARAPKSRLEYWGPKLARNIARDAEHLSSLAERGWSSLVIWECETRDAKALAARLRKFLK